MKQPRTSLRGQMTMQTARNLLVGVALATAVFSCSVAQSKRGAVFFGMVPLAEPKQPDNNRVPNPIENPIPQRAVNPWVEPAYTPVPRPTTDDAQVNQERQQQTVAHTDPVQFTLATLIAAAFGVLPGIGLFRDW